MTTTVPTAALTPQAYTEGVIAHSLGIPVQNLGKGTVAYHLSQGRTPEWIAREVFSVTVSTES